MNACIATRPALNRRKAGAAPGRVAGGTEVEEEAAEENGGFTVMPRRDSSESEAHLQPISDERQVGPMDQQVQEPVREQGDTDHHPGP